MTVYMIKEMLTAKKSGNKTLHIIGKEEQYLSFSLDRNAKPGDEFKMICKNLSQIERHANLYGYTNKSFCQKKMDKYITKNIRIPHPIYDFEYEVIELDIDD